MKINSFMFSGCSRFFFIWETLTYKESVSINKLQSEMTSFCNEIKYDFNIHLSEFLLSKKNTYSKNQLFLFVSNQLRDQSCVLCFSKEKLPENKHLQTKVVGKGSVLSYIYIHIQWISTKKNLYISTVSALN